MQTETRSHFLNILARSIFVMALAAQAAPASAKADDTEKQILAACSLYRDIHAKMSPDAAPTPGPASPDRRVQAAGTVVALTAVGIAEVVARHAKSELNAANSAATDLAIEPADSLIVRIFRNDSQLLAMEPNVRHYDHYMPSAQIRFLQNERDLAIAAGDEKSRMFITRLVGEEARAWLAKDTGLAVAKAAAKLMAIRAIQAGTLGLGALFDIIANPSSTASDDTPQGQAEKNPFYLLYGGAKDDFACKTFRENAKIRATFLAGMAAVAGQEQKMSIDIQAIVDATQSTLKATPSSAPNVASLPSTTAPATPAL